MQMLLYKEHDSKKSICGVSHLNGPTQKNDFQKIKNEQA
jgi:hypothetical protein